MPQDHSRLWHALQVIPLEHVQTGISYILPTASVQQLYQQLPVATLGTNLSITMSQHEIRNYYLANHKMCGQFS